MEVTILEPGACTFYVTDDPRTHGGYAEAMADPARNEHLFVVRIWTEPAVQGLGSQRGCIEHIASNERRYFSQLAEAWDFLAAMAEADGPRMPQRPLPPGLGDAGDSSTDNAVHPVSGSIAQNESVDHHSAANADHPR